MAAAAGFKAWLDDYLLQKAQLPPRAVWRGQLGNFAGLSKADAQRILNRHPERTRQVPDGRAKHSRRFRHQVGSGLRLWRSAQADLGFFKKQVFLLGK